jgi:hypothetical protein
VASEFLQGRGPILQTDFSRPGLGSTPVNDLAQRDAALKLHLDSRGPLLAGGPFLVVALITVMLSPAGVLPLSSGLAIAGLLAFAGILRSSLALDRRRHILGAPSVVRARTRDRR